MVRAALWIIRKFYRNSWAGTISFGGKAGKGQKVYCRHTVDAGAFQSGSDSSSLFSDNAGSAFAMFTMIIGFVTNLILDYQFVWVCNWNTKGAALATVKSQGIN